MPVFFDSGSVAQLVFGLLICFISFGAYMLLSPYVEPSDDRLAQLCQMQIFFSLVSSLLLRFNAILANDEDATPIRNLDVLLSVFTFVPLGFAVVVHVLENGLYEYFRGTWIDPSKERLRRALDLVVSRRWW